MRVITNKKKTGRKTIFSIGFFNAAPKKKKKNYRKNRVRNGKNSISSKFITVV